MKNNGDDGQFLSQKLQTFMNANSALITRWRFWLTGEPLVLCFACSAIYNNQLRFLFHFNVEDYNSYKKVHYFKLFIFFSDSRTRSRNRLLNTDTHFTCDFPSENILFIRKMLNYMKSICQLKVHCKKSFFITN